MDRSISRLVAIVVYANYHLKGNDLDIDMEKLATDNCYALEFIDSPPSDMAGSTRIISSTASEWFRYLKDSGAAFVKLHYTSSNHQGLPDHITAAFKGGGSTWLLEVSYLDSSDVYTEAGSPSRKAQLMRVQKSGDLLEGPSLKVNKARQSLRAILEAIAEFAAAHEHSAHWAENFNGARKALDEYAPSATDSFIPAGMVSKEARQLLYAAEASWVFGGMCSWNDMAFSGSDQGTYSDLTGQLYNAICDAIVAAANDSIPS
jgi:hypothetical protein